MELQLILLAVALAAMSGVPGLLASRRAAWGQWTATILITLGGITGITASFMNMLRPDSITAVFTGIWPNVPLHLRLDPLSAFFLVLVFLMAGGGSVYGMGYWRQTDHPRTGRKLRFIYGLMIASMALVTLADDVFAFLLAWEVMALTSYFLIATEDQKPQCRQAAWIYLVAAHIVTLALMAMFALILYASGSVMLRPLAVSVGLRMETAIFLLALVGFGLKAGIMPMHFWLPGAHANAPSHISALLSGVLLKIGIYGLLRILTLLPELPPIFGILILTLGSLNAVLGVALALGQHDIKRLLAYHSIENIGIILMGLGLAMIGMAIHHPVWVVLGIAGSLLHVWNHGLFKSLLFFSAGSAVHATGTREIDAMGGLARRMPLSSGLFMIGAVAICGLPPLNGFVSELLVYLGLMRPAADTQAGGWSAVAIGAVVLAMVGALAVSCFVKVFGVTFLGTARTHAADRAQESSQSMIAAMAVIAALCALIGLCPVLVVIPLGHAASVWSGGIVGADYLANAAPWGVISIVNLFFAVVVGGLACGLWYWRWKRPLMQVPTWCCGFVRPSNRMQYTASSFARTLVGLMAWMLRPIRSGSGPLKLFAESAEIHSHVPDFVSDRAAYRAWQWFKVQVSPVRQFQQGSVQQYLLYILLAMFVLMLSLVPVSEIIKRLEGH